MTTEQWVKKLNRLAFEIDRICDSIHPSAWDENIQTETKKYKILAKAKTDD